MTSSRITALHAREAGTYYGILSRSWFPGVALREYEVNAGRAHLKQLLQSWKQWKSKYGSGPVTADIAGMFFPPLFITFYWSLTVPPQGVQGSLLTVVDALSDLFRNFWNIPHFLLEKARASKNLAFLEMAEVACAVVPNDSWNEIQGALGLEMLKSSW
jgi:hypothetical protein